MFIGKRETLMLKVAEIESSQNLSRVKITVAAMAKMQRRIFSDVSAIKN
jgi:hypothetical protein